MMIGKTPIERAAFAAQCRIFQPTGGIARDIRISGAPAEIAATYREIARAVLTSIREPSEAMIAAAARCESSLVSDIYTAMIDAALDEAA